MDEYMGFRWKRPVTLKKGTRFRKLALFYEQKRGSVFEVKVFNNVPSLLRTPPNFAKYLLHLRPLVFLLSTPNHQKVFRG